jgi:hypothetical protein
MAGTSSIAIAEPFINIICQQPKKTNGLSHDMYNEMRGYFSQSGFRAERALRGFGKKYLICSRLPKQQKVQ